MAALRRVVSLLVLAAGLGGCVVYPDGSVVPLGAPPPTASVVVGGGLGWGGYGYYRPWGGYYRPWWRGPYRPWGYRYGPRPYYGWRRW